MRKQILITCAIASTLLLSQNAIGQTWTNSGGDIYNDIGTNNVGIGLSIGAALPHRLNINGDIGFENGNAYRHMWGHSDHGLAIYSKNSWTDGSGILLDAAGGPVNGAISFISNPATATDNSFAFINNNGGSWYWLTLITGEGDLSIRGSSIQYGPGAWWNRYLKGNTSESFAIFANTDWSQGAGIMLNGNTASSGPGDVAIVAGNGGGQGGNMSFARWNGSGWTTNMFIDKDGKIAIGSVPTPAGYRLYVQEGILTEKIKVALSNDPTNWSDFVFADDYDLRSINDVEEYIKKNKHLPEIPSTEEVHANGLDLAQMDAKLLQKIEELTLYIIQQQKEIEKLKAKMN